jgi:hypothetical protein
MGKRRFSGALPKGCLGRGSEGVGEAAIRGGVTMPVEIQWIGFGIEVIRPFEVEAITLP